MGSQAWAKRGNGRFEVRVLTPSTAGAGTRTVYLRTSKLELGIMALADIARKWANDHGAVPAGTVADVIDTNDGGPVAQLKFLGFEPGTLDGALHTLRANGFPNLQEVANG